MYMSTNAQYSWYSDVLDRGMCQCIQQPTQGADTEAVAVLEFDMLHKKHKQLVTSMQEVHPIDQDILNYMLNQQRREAAITSDTTRDATVNTASMSQQIAETFRARR